VSLKQASVEQLVAIVQVSGDSAAFNELFSRYDNKLRAFLAFKSADQRHDIDDLVQETYVNAFLNIQQFKQQSQFATWLLRIAINEMLQAKRSGNIFARLKDRWFSDEANTLSHSDNTATQLDAATLIAGLTTLQQQVFVYTEFYGYSQSEIADKLQIPLGSVKTYMKQARDTLDRSNTPC
jgi:RNA polymerase sigma-70 factor (ECF subfamily)